MRPDDVRRVMADPIAVELLASSIPARLAYSWTDGSPRAVPVGFAWTGDDIVVCTPDTAPKVRAIQANPAVALTIDTDRQPPHVLLVRGTATVDIVPGVPEEYLDGARKLIAAEQWDMFETEVRALYPRMARIAIRPTWAKVLDFVTRAPETVMRLAADRGRR